MEKILFQGSLFFDLQEIIAMALSFSICSAIILLCSLSPRLSGRSHDLSAVQSMHTQLTPRIGGIAIFGTLVLAVVFAPFAFSGPYSEVIFAASFLFAVGLAEDLGFHMSPRRRMMAAIGASLLVIWLLEMWLPRAGIPFADAYMGYWFIGIPVTIFVTVGVANGFNLIDGVNGLAALAAIAAAVAFNQISVFVDHPEMVYFSMMIIAGILGFFILNFPLGLIFLGDAGAYTIGFVLSWFGIALMVVSPDISPWAILLTVYWPLADTALAIFRRARSKSDVSAADRLHVHQMTMRALEICVLGRNRRNLANPLTTLLLAPFVIAPPIAGALLWNQNFSAFLAVVAFGVLFFGSYAAAPKLILRFRRQAGVGDRGPEATDRKQFI